MEIDAGSLVGKPLVSFIGEAPPPPIIQDVLIELFR